MARELILRISCSGCEADIPQEDPAYDNQILLRLGSLEGKLDLCKACNESLHEALGPYLGLLEETVKPKPAVVKPGSRIVAMVCPRCDNQVAGSSTPLRKHLMSTHGMTKEEAVKIVPMGQPGFNYEDQYPDMAGLIIRGA